MAAPFFLGFVVVFLLPVLYAVYESLFRVKSAGGLGLGGRETSFVGMDNFVEVFHDGTFWASMVRVAVFAVVQIPISLGLSLLMALLLDAARQRVSRVFRFLLLVPYMIPVIVSALIWVYLYSPHVGPLTKLGDLVGLDVNFFGSDMLWVSIGNLIMWTCAGFNMLILFGALQGVDRELFEAARLDGADEVRIAWSIKLPHLRGSLVLTGLLSIIGLLQIFNEPLLFRAASPETVTKDFTPIMAIYNYAFGAGGSYNYAAALSLVLAAVIGAISVLFYRLTNRPQ